MSYERYHLGQAAEDDQLLFVCDNNSHMFVARSSLAAKDAVIELIRLANVGYDAEEAAKLPAGD